MIVPGAIPCRTHGHHPAPTMIIIALRTTPLSMSDATTRNTSVTKTRR
jgi:hypothetical protein